MPHATMPRLLPTTIAALGAVLAVKSVVLVRAALPQAAQQPALLAPAQAASPDRPAAPVKAPSPAAPANQAKSPAPAPPAAPPAPEIPEVSVAEKALLLQLRDRRKELDGREVALSARESLLIAAEQKLNARVEELLALQKKLETLEAARQQREELGWQGLVKVYEAMKPRDAAAIFNDLQMPVLLPVLDRMKEAKAAPILAAMNADKAREVTTELARLRTSRNAQSESAPPPRPGG
jgi:flagellar motility protein MotE (MotC chaperone)